MVFMRTSCQGHTRLHFKMFFLITLEFIISFWSSESAHSKLTNSKLTMALNVVISRFPISTVRSQIHSLTLLPIRICFFAPIPHHIPIGWMCCSHWSQIVTGVALDVSGLLQMLHFLYSNDKMRNPLYGQIRLLHFPPFCCSQSSTRYYWREGIDIGMRQVAKLATIL